MTMSESNAVLLNVFSEEIDDFSILLSRLVTDEYVKLPRRVVTIREARLLWIIERFGGVGINRVAERSGVSRENVVTSLAKLLNGGFVTKDWGVKERKGRKIVELTPKGSKVVAQYRKAMLAAAKDALKRMSNSLAAKRGFLDCAKSFNDSFLQQVEYTDEMSSEDLARLPWKKNFERNERYREKKKRLEAEREQRVRDALAGRQ